MDMNNEPVAWIDPRELDMTSSPEADAIRYARAILRKAQEK